MSGLELTEEMQTSCPPAASGDGSKCAASCRAWASGLSSTVSPASSRSGWVRNDAAGVTIEVEGEPARSTGWPAACATKRRRWARVDSVTCSACEARREGAASRIVDSIGGRAATAIGPDSAMCGDCLREMFDPRERRYRYAFINCTHCGPRYTITRRVAVRPRDDQHGGVRAMPALSCRVPLAARPPLPRRTERVSGLRTAARVARRRRAPVAGADPVAATVARLRAATSSRSRAWAAFILHATRATRRPWRGCASARRATRSRSR